MHEGLPSWVAAYCPGALKRCWNVTEDEPA